MLYMNIKWNLYATFQMDTIIKYTYAQGKWNNSFICASNMHTENTWAMISILSQHSWSRSANYKNIHCTNDHHMKESACSLSSGTVSGISQW